PDWLHSSYFGAAAPPVFGTIARNSNGSCERFSPACRWTPTQSIVPARRCISFALPSGWVSRKCASVSHTTSLALAMSCIGVFSCGAMRTRTTTMDSFSNSTLASTGPAAGGAGEGCGGIACVPGPACCAQLDSDAKARQMQPMKIPVFAEAYLIATGPLLESSLARVRDRGRDSRVDTSGARLTLTLLDRTS